MGFPISGAGGLLEAYPAYARLRLDFAAMANPRWFRDDPAMAWGFYGHRPTSTGAPARTRGSQVLRRWAERLPAGGFVLTSNVDGQFQRAGFDPDRVSRVHGAIDQMQCTGECGVGIFPAGPSRVDVDQTTMAALDPLPPARTAARWPGRTS